MTLPAPMLCLRLSLDPLRSALAFFSFFWASFAAVTLTQDGGLLVLVEEWLRCLLQLE